MPSIRYRFESFTYDVKNRELIGPQGAALLPMQESLVLEALLREAGSTVSKQKLAKTLWPEEEYGDFDRAINNIVSKLRRSLGINSGETTGQCILTIPKAGYRLQCEVSVEESAPARLPDPSPSSLPITLSTAHALNAPPLPLVSTPAATARRSPGLRIVWAGLALFLLAALSIVLILPRMRYKEASPPVVMGILPLEVTSGDPSDGETLRGELADAIAQIPNVQVRAAHSLSRDMGSDAQTIQNAARNLSLNLLLVGTLELSPDRYQLNLELIRGSDSAHLRSFHFAGPRLGLPEVPAAVENNLYEQIAVKGSNTESTPQIVQGGTQNIEAYNLAFQAAHLLSERSKESLEKAIGLYQRAVQLDPHFARAWSGLAESYLVTADFGAGPVVQQNFEKTRQAADRAIQLNPEDARAHSVLGLLLLQHEWNLQEAEKELRTAIRLNPGLATNHTRLAVLLADRKDFKEAEAETELAHQLDPLWPIVYGTSLYVHIMGREYAKAIQNGQSLVNMRPSWGRAHQQLGWAYWYGGKHVEAIEEWREAAKLDNDTIAYRIENDGLRILNEDGVRAYAHAKLTALGAQGANDDFVPAEWYAFAGDRTETLAALRTMVDQRDPESLKIPINPAYDFLRNDPNYIALRDRIHSETLR